MEVARHNTALGPAQCSPPPWEQLVALDLNTESIRWRQAGADGEGTGPILSASFGTEWRMLLLTAGGRFNRMRIDYTRLDDLGGHSGREFLDDPNVDLSGVFVRLGLAFRWFPD